MKVFLAGEFPGGVIKQINESISRRNGADRNGYSFCSQIVKAEREREGESGVNVYLAESGQVYRTYLAEAEIYRDANILQSFYYASDFTEKVIIPNCKDFLLDSGAFTFMQNAKAAVKWEEYIEKYAAFINRNNVEKFFELDIDSIVGYETVLRYRDRLESLTGKKPIPVWHNSRGKEAFIQDSQSYDYVAIGGLVSGSGEYSRKYWQFFPWFIETAHKNGAKIHALGFTSLDGIRKYHFDSVDSTAWVSGNRFGAVYYFDGFTMKHIDKPQGKRVKTNQTAIHNFCEWKNSASSQKRIYEVVNLKKYSFLQLVLTVVSVSSLMISNILTAKQILLPFGISMTCGAIVFPLTYVLSDVFSEVYGYKWSRITCYIGFAMNVLMVAFFEIAIIVKSPEWFENQDAFVSVLGSAPRILLASFLAFLLGDFVNDNVFAKMKAKHTDLKGFGTRAILSSFFGQITDSTIFIPIAFAGQMKAAEIMALIAAEVCVKTTCEIIIYPLTRFAAKKVCDYERACDNAAR